MKSDKAHFIAFVGVMFALIFVLFLLEGAISIGTGVSTCVLSLPVAVSLSIYDDWKKSFIGGTLLGLSSCIFCFIIGEIIYANPLICILPRFFIGVTAYWTYFGLSKLFKRAKSKFIRQMLPAGIAGAIGSITNTVLYLLSLNIWSGDFMGAFTQILEIAVSIYFPIELVACIILVPTYVAVLKKISHKFVEVKVKPTDEGETKENPISEVQEAEPIEVENVIEVQSNSNDEAINIAGLQPEDHSSVCEIERMSPKNEESVE